MGDKNNMNINKIKLAINNLLTENPKKEILKKINELIVKKKPIKLSQLLKELRTHSGVYLIYPKKFEKENFIYVGETRNLLGRLKTDMSGGRTSLHTFLKKIAMDFNLSDKEEIKKKIEEDFLFSVIETQSKEMAFVIEGVINRRYKPKFNKKQKDIGIQKYYFS